MYDAVICLHNDKINNKADMNGEFYLLPQHGPLLESEIVSSRALQPTYLVHMYSSSNGVHTHNLHIFKKREERERERLGK